MNEKEFKKHLRDLAHGHHHPEEHDWVNNGTSVSAPGAAVARSQTQPKPNAKAKAKRRRQLSSKRAR